jgi:hypothetical protein
LVGEGEIEIRQILWSVVNSGHAEDQASYRSELSGLLAILIIGNNLNEY